jgi:hypothetical protein
VPNTGPLASAAWLVQLGLVPSEPKWFVEIVLGDNSEIDETSATWFKLDVYAEEWGYTFCHAGHRSWIRVTDIRFVHGRDDHDLLLETPPLRDIGRLVRSLETRHQIQLRRRPALVRTSLLGMETSILEWTTRL